MNEYFSNFDSFSAILTKVEIGLEVHSVLKDLKFGLHHLETYRYQ